MIMPVFFLCVCVSLSMSTPLHTRVLTCSCERWKEGTNDKTNGQNSSH